MDILLQNNSKMQFQDHNVAQGCSFIEFQDHNVAQGCSFIEFLSFKFKIVFFYFDPKYFYDMAICYIS